MKKSDINNNSLVHNKLLNEKRDKKTIKEKEKKIKKKINKIRKS